MPGRWRGREASMPGSWRGRVAHPAQPPPYDRMIRMIRMTRRAGVSGAAGNRHQPFFGCCPRGVPRGVPQTRTARTAQRLQRQLQTAPRESDHQMSLQRREGACGDVQDHHGAGPGETPTWRRFALRTSCSKGLSGARPLDKVFDADTRAVPAF